MSGIEGQPGRVIYALIMAGLLAVIWQLQVPAITVLWLALLWWLVCFGLVSRYPAGSDRWGAVPLRALMGLFVLVPAWVGLNHLRTGSFQFGELTNNLLAILYIFFVVWVADIGAYFAGRAFGKRSCMTVNPAGVRGGLAAVAAGSGGKPDCRCRCRNRSAGAGKPRYRPGIGAGGFAGKHAQALPWYQRQQPVAARARWHYGPY